MMGMLADLGQASPGGAAAMAPAVSEDGRNTAAEIDDPVVILGPLPGRGMGLAVVTTPWAQPGGGLFSIALAAELTACTRRRCASCSGNRS